MKVKYNAEWISTWWGQLIIFMVGVGALSSFHEGILLPFAISFALALWTRGAPFALALGAILMAPHFVLGSLDAYANELPIAVHQEDQIGILKWASWIFPLVCGTLFVLSSNWLRVAQNRWPRLPRRVFWLALGVYLLLITRFPVGTQMNLTQALLSMLLVSGGFYIWYFAYECLSMDNDTQAQGWRLWAYFRPFWSIAYIAPFPGGQRSLQSMRCQEAARLRECQISGLGLLIASILFQWVFQYWWSAAGPQEDRFLWFDPPLLLKAPSVSEALQVAATGKSYQPLEMWWIIFTEFFRNLLGLASRGHFIVGILRVLGFLAPRNTDRPLGSSSFVEFFNRYNFYYKELLFNIFYLPLYFGWLSRIKAHMRLRIVLATFFAAGLGNFVVHITLHSRYFFRLGFFGGLREFSQYGFYCFILSVAVAFSQIRLLQGRRHLSRHQKIAAQISIVIFFAFLRMFDDAFHGDIRNNFSLVSNAFGFHWGH